MKILSKETVAKKIEHKVKSIFCDHNECKKEIPIGESYYQLDIDRDNGIDTYVERKHFCRECFKSIVSDFVDELCDRQELTATCYTRTDNETEEVSEFEEVYGFSYEDSMSIEN